MHTIVNNSYSLLSLLLFFLFQKVFSVCAVLLCIWHYTDANNEHVTQDKFNTYTAINKRSVAAEAEETGDLDTAETLVFRPLFRSRFFVNRRRPFYYRRRFYRNIDDDFPNNFLVGDGRNFLYY